MTQQAPQEVAAQLYMEHKGYPDARPFDSEKLDDWPCWYFYYDLPEGRLELEVYWDVELNDWVCTSTGFVAD